MKLFLKKFAQVGGIIALALVLGIGVSVFAENYVGPGVFPANAPVPLNVTDVMQTKLGTANFGNNVGVTNTANVLGAVNVGARAVDTGGSAFTSALNVFGKTFINNVDTTFGGLKIGGAANSKGLVSDSLRAAIDIDLTGRTGTSGTDVISMKSAVGTMKSAFITNAGAIQFWSDMGREARLWAGSIKLSDYSPAPGKILASGDAEGNAVWSTFDAGETKVVHVSTVDRDTGNPRVNKAYCPTGYVAIGGGGDCEHGDIRISQPIRGTPSPDDNSWYTLYETNTDTGAGDASVGANGWMINCGNNNSDGDIHVDVMCIKVTPPTLTVPTPTAVTPVPAGVVTPPSTPSWKAVTKADGALGQTCTAWLAQAPNMAGIAPNTQPQAYNEDTQTMLSNSCVYANVTTNTCEILPPSHSSANRRPAGECSDTDRYGTNTYR